MCASHLEVSVYYAIFMQVADSLKHLFDHFAGVPLSVNPPV